MSGFSTPRRTRCLQWNAKEYTTNGTFVYIVPYGVRQLFVEVCGAGGGGDGSCPGSDGGYGADYLDVVPGEQFTVVVGAAGTSGGGTGGTSSFGSEISATGGACAGGTNWNPSHGTSSNKINQTGGGARGGARSTAGEKGSVVVWTPQVV